ncbi:hypothetical protein KJ885_02185 [Patescibacteria group bacterium]|nr:hypothetical protein [Patescibacteria group bacterium]
MVTTLLKEKITETITLTMDGELLEGGSIEYKTFLDVLDGTVGAIEGMVRATQYKQLINFNIRPPKEKCFQISLEVFEWLGAMKPLFDCIPFVQNIVKVFFEYLKIKKALKGEEIRSENIQKNENGSTIIKNNLGRIVYEDHRKIINKNTIVNLNNSPFVNKKLDKVAQAIEMNKKIDNLSYTPVSGEGIQISRNEAEYFKYQEKTEQRPDSVIGFIRKIDNKNFRGVVIIQDDGRERNVDFALSIENVPDLRLLDKIVSNLAHAEADKLRVVLTGEKVFDSREKLKKIIVKDVNIPDVRFEF